MAIKMRGVVAAPGEYKYGDTVEVKTEEELKRDVKERPFVPLTYGHVQPTYNEDSGTWDIDDDLIIGSVYRKWSNRDKRVNAKVNFYEEKMPAAIRKRIDNGEKIPVSAGIFLDSVDENNIQHGIETTHIAVLEGENPTCPLEICGLDIREESSGSRIRRLEQQTALEPSPPKTAEKEEEATPEPAESAGPEQPKPEEVAPEAEISPVAESDEVQEEAEEAVVEAEVPLEPELVIPASAPAVQKQVELIDGVYSFVPEIFKQKEKK